MSTPDAQFLGLLEMLYPEGERLPPVPADDYVEDGFTFESNRDDVGSVWWVVTPTRLFEVDGIRYDHPGCHARLMIDLTDEGCSCRRQWLSDPPTEAELDRYVKTGKISLTTPY